METIVKEIMAAEERAEQTVSEAKEEARRIAAEAAAEAERRLAAARAQAEAERAARLAGAEAEAARIYEEILKSGVQRATQRAERAHALVDAAAKKIIEAVVHGDR